MKATHCIKWNEKLPFLTSLLYLTVFFSFLLLFTDPLLSQAANELDTLKAIITGESSKNTPEKESITPIERLIDTESSATDDKKIRNRLQKIYGELESMRNIEISEVSNGVVTLAGEVETTALLDRALQFARQVEGVVEVKHRITVDRSLKNRLQQTNTKLLSIFQSIIVNLPLVVLAIFIIWFFWFIGTLFSRWLPFIRKRAPNAFISKLLSQLFQLFFLLAGIILAFTLLDATAVISTILGAAGILGLAISFAVRDTVENYIASILLSLRNPFEPNDFVRIDNLEGHVARLTSRATILISLEGLHIRIPNAIVFKATITNYTRNRQRRFNFQVGVDTDNNLLEVQTIAMKALLAQPGLLQEPKPNVLIQELGDSNVILSIFAWIDQNSHDLVKVRSETIRLIKETFDKANIGMPEPIYQVKIQEQSAEHSPAAQIKENASRRQQPGTKKRAEHIEDHLLRPDISRDDSLDKQLAKEQADADENSNLLSPKSPNE